MMLFVMMIVTMMDDDENDNDIMEVQGVGNYGDVDVTLVREDVLAFYTLRTFNIQVI